MSSTLRESAPPIARAHGGSMPIQVAPSPFGLFAVFAVLAGSAMLACLAWRYYFDTRWQRSRL